MKEFLFNPALWMPALGFAIAIALFIYGNARVKPGIRNGGLGLLGLMVAWCAAAYFVQTPVEQCIARTRAIVSAVEKADWVALAPLLDKNTTIDVKAMPINGRDAIVSTTQTTAGAYGLKSIRMYGTDVSQGPNSIDVTFSALLEGVQPLTATFRFEYEQRSDGMLLAKIVPVKIGDKSMDEIRRAIR